MNARGRKENSFYAKLGVRPIINACGTLTRLGGSLMDPAVLEAMAEASRCFVDVNELLAKAGDYIAGLLGVEAAYITSGAAAGLTLATAACITGTDLAKIRRLPDLTGLKDEVIIQKAHRNGYDQAVRQVNVKVVEIGVIKETYAWELEAAINGQTAAIVHFMEFESHRTLPLTEVICIAQAAGVPVIVDAAAELPPLENLHLYTDLGADLALFSGGKDIAGPQSTGLILGRRDLIRACALNACPNYSLGRPMKVGKEEIAGLVKALELYLEQDFAREAETWESWVAYIVQALSDLPGVHARRVSPSEPGIDPTWIPRVYIDWDKQVIPLSREEVMRRLLEGEPAVAVGLSSTGVAVNPQTLEPGEEKIVAERLRAVLT